MSETEETLEQFVILSAEDLYYDLNFAHVPSFYIDTSRAEWRLLTFEEEATDEEILRCAEKSGHFDFLHEPEEDIYGMNDGEPV